jgi:hypothetical protein
VLCRGEADKAEIAFQYLGPTREQATLRSGTVRTQIGLKLRAHDACNLAYVMWRIEPEPRIVVSVKRNPGEHTSAECENRGYENLKASREAAAPAVRIGMTHVMRAQLSGNSLVVTADGKMVWNGELPEWTAGLHGPAGFRTDNGRFAIRFAAAP